MTLVIQDAKCGDIATMRCRQELILVENSSQQAMGIVLMC